MQCAQLHKAVLHSPDPTSNMSHRATIFSPSSSPSLSFPLSCNEKQKQGVARNIPQTPTHLRKPRLSSFLFIQSPTCTLATHLTCHRAGRNVHRCTFTITFSFTISKSISETRSGQTWRRVPDTESSRHHVFPSHETYSRFSFFQSAQLI